MGALRNWELKLVVDRSSATPLGAQLVRWLVDDIGSGRLAPGTVLPGTRVLAMQLGLSRKTVTLAYDELASQGWVNSEPQRGTFVSLSLPVAAGRLAAPGTAPQIAPHSAALFRSASPTPAYEPPVPGVIVLDDGLPDARLLPAPLLARAYARALAQSAGANDLHYADPRGDAGLRAAIASMLTLERGIACGPHQLCLTRGSQMAIALILRLHAGPGTTVALERLSYGPVRDMALALGARVSTVGLDEHGIDPDALEALCRRERVRVVYVTPHHQFPTTVAMRPERRMRLLVLAAQFGFVIIEDDYDHEFHFEGRPLLPLIGADRDGRVAYVGSFSKLLSPSLRLGFVAGPADLIDRVAQEIMIFDRQGDRVTERAVALLMQDGTVLSHVRRALRVYAERRLQAAALLEPAFEFTPPAGGLALWARPKRSRGLEDFRQTAAASGVLLLASRQFVIDETSAPGFRIGFASLNEAEFAEAARRLSRSCP
jgi:GntR family transcriptional regulator/MocR family aminotransferase